VGEREREKRCFVSSVGFFALVVFEREKSYSVDL